ncbi:MAG: glutathione S-transferase family protein [Rhodospirillales bacterium]|nr:glutathione S-transferase family protein [Rhodospirillales bacterium]
MAIELYELVGTEDRRFSPYCWRIRMALAHKGLEADIIPCRFTEKDKIAFSGGRTVPALRDGAAELTESWAIACYLEDTYADRPSLFGGDIGRAEARFINHWVDSTLHGTMIRPVVLDIHDHLDPVDQAYFRETREKRLGATLEEIQGQRDQVRPALNRSFRPLNALLKEQDFVCGDAPAYGDYIVFGAFQWVRSISPYAMVESDDPIHAWRERMLDLYDGLARSVTAYPS